MDGLSAGLPALMIRSQSSNWSQYPSAIKLLEFLLIAEFGGQIEWSAAEEILAPCGLMQFNADHS